MDKLTAIKIKYDDGTYSDEIPVSVLSENVEWDNTHTLVDVLGSIDVDVTGTIQDQISQLFNEKVSTTALANYVATQLNTDVSNWLNNNVNPVGSAVVVDSSLSIQGAAADAQATGNKINALINSSNNFIIQNYDDTAGWIEITDFTIIEGGFYGIDDDYGDFRFYASDFWGYTEIPVNENEVYQIRGYAVAMGKLYYCLTSDNKVLSCFPIPAQRGVFTETVTIPNNCIKLLINQEFKHEIQIKKQTRILKPNTKFDIDILNLVSDNLNIERYKANNKKEDISSQLIIYDNQARNNARGIIINLNGWEFGEISCNGNETYWISGTGGSSVYFYYCLDDNDRILSYGPQLTVTTKFNDYQITTPASATKIAINNQKSLNTLGIKKLSNKINYEYDYIPLITPLAKQDESNPNRYDIIIDKYDYEISLNGSNNGSFNMQQIKYNNTLFKSCSDDITPMNLTTVGYIGANHGYNFIYEIKTSVAHNLSSNLIGKVYTDNNNEDWVLVKIIDDTTIQIICRSDNWFGAKTVNSVPATVNFNNIDLTVSNSQLRQLYPSIKNKNVNIIENNKNTTFTIFESYDIIDLKDGIEKLIANLGSNTNDSIVNRSQSLINIENLYVYDNEGTCTVKTNYKFLKDAIPVNFIGGIQSIGFDSSSNYFGVGDSVYSKLSTASSSIYFNKTDWNDENIPPKIYYQSADNKMFVVGFLMDDNYRNNNITNQAGFYYISKKMYPYVFQPQSSFNNGDVLSVVGFRIALYKNENSTIIPYLKFFTVNNKKYLFTYIINSGNYKIPLTQDLYGKNINIISSNNIIINSKITIANLDITVESEGSLLVQFE